MAGEIAELETTLSLQTPEENLRAGVYNQVEIWVRTEFKGRLTSAIARRIELRDKKKDMDKEAWRQETLTNHKKLAQIQFGYVRVMWAARQLADLNEAEHGKALHTLAKNVEDNLFHKPNSVVTAGRSPEEQDRLENSLVGAITVLKFLDLYQASMPQGFRESFRGAIKYSVDNDVRHKVDLEFRFGDRNPKTGKEIVRLIQLKTAAQDKGLAVAEVTSAEKIPDRVQDYVKAEDARKMHDYARRLEQQNPNLEVHTFISAIPCARPGHGSSDNALGIETGYTQGTRVVSRQAVINKFTNEASEVGLLPK